MKVNITTRDRDMDIVKEESYDFQNYFDYLASRTMSLLYSMEDYKLDLIGHEVLRKDVLSLAGHLKRLPQNMTFAEEDVI
ncbi:hypothetical protein G9F71_008290 [Clostridium sp. FP2]|uniref:hypothetical protein n=1 Tax=Clostridium sp. FP2 TaxID=2724481 RepID=UPI0013E93819|nr:hypothetical protein [Clostridium sp. FP2]MBZ9622850.1 hypothetical protein [Clostridium sp. FP2]